MRSNAETAREFVCEPSRVVRELKDILEDFDRQFLFVHWSDAASVFPRQEYKSAYHMRNGKTVWDAASVASRCANFRNVIRLCMKERPDLFDTIKPEDVLRFETDLLHGTEEIPIAKKHGGVVFNTRVVESISVIDNMISRFVDDLEFGMERKRELPGVTIDAVCSKLCRQENSRRTLKRILEMTRGGARPSEIAAKHPGRKGFSLANISEQLTKVKKQFPGFLPE